LNESSPAYKKIVDLELVNEQLEEELNLLRRQQKLNNEALSSRLQGIYQVRLFPAQPLKNLLY